MAQAPSSTTLGVWLPTDLKGAFCDEARDAHPFPFVDHTLSIRAERRRARRGGRKDSLGVAPDGRFSPNVPQRSSGGWQSAAAACRGDRGKERRRDRYVDRLFRPLVLSCPPKDWRTLDDVRNRSPQS